MAKATGGKQPLSKQLGLASFKWDTSAHFTREPTHVHGFELLKTASTGSPAPLQQISFGFPTDSEELSGDSVQKTHTRHSTTDSAGEGKKDVSSDSSSTRVSIPIHTGKRSGSTRPSSGSRSHGSSMEHSEGDSLESPEKSTFQPFRISGGMHKDMDKSTEDFEKELASYRQAKPRLEDTSSDSFEFSRFDDSTRSMATGLSAQNTHYSGKLNERHLFSSSSPKKNESRKPSESSSVPSPQRPPSRPNSSPTTPQKTYRVAKTSTAAGTSQKSQRQFQALQTSPSSHSSSYRPDITTLPVVQTASKYRPTEKPSTNIGKRPSNDALQSTSNPETTRERTTAVKEKGNGRANVKTGEKQSGREEAPESLPLTDSQVIGPTPSTEDMLERYTSKKHKEVETSASEKMGRKRETPVMRPVSLGMDVDDGELQDKHVKESNEPMKELVMIDDDDDDDDGVLNLLSHSGPSFPSKATTTTHSETKNVASHSDQIAEKITRTQKNLFVKSAASDADTSTKMPTTTSLKSSSASIEEIKPSEARGNAKGSTKRNPPPTDAPLAITSKITPKHGILGIPKAGLVLQAPVPTKMTKSSGGPTSASEASEASASPKKKTALVAKSSASRFSSQGEDEEATTANESSGKFSARSQVNAILETLGSSTSSPAKSKASSKKKSTRTAFGEDTDFSPAPYPTRSTRTRKGPPTIELIELSDDDEEQGTTELGPAEQSTPPVQPEDMDIKRPVTRSSARRGMFDDTSYHSGQQSGLGGVESSHSLLPLTISSELEDQLHFHLSYYQDDIGRGHVALDAPQGQTENSSASLATTPIKTAPMKPSQPPSTKSSKKSEPTHETKALQYDSRLSFSLNREGIFIWKVLPLSKKKSGSNTPRTKKTVVKEMDAGAKDSFAFPEEPPVETQRASKIDDKVLKNADERDIVDTETKEGRKKARKSTSQESSHEEVLVHSTAEQMDVDIVVINTQSQDDGTEASKRTRTTRSEVVPPSSNSGKSRTKKVDVGDVDSKVDDTVEDEEHEAKESERIAVTPKRSSTAAKSKRAAVKPTHELLAYIPARRIVSVDVFAQPGLFFIYTSSGRSMSVVPPSTELCGSASTDTQHSLSNTSDTGDKKGRETVSGSVTPNAKKRKRQDDAEPTANVIAVDMDLEEEPKSSKNKRRKSASSHPSVFSTPSIVSENVKNADANDILDLSYEVDAEDEANAFLDVSDFIDSDQVPSTGDSPTKKRGGVKGQAIEVKEGEDVAEPMDPFEPTYFPSSSTVINCKTFDAESCRLFVVVCDRDDLHNILNQLRELSDFLASSSSSPDSDSDSSPPLTMKNDSKMDVDEKGDTSTKSSSSSSTFEIFGRSASLKPIPLDLVQLCWKPELVAEADKNSSSTLKSPASKLKSPSSTPSASQLAHTSSSCATLPLVYSKRKLTGEDAHVSADEILLRKQTQHHYCDPYSMDNLVKTMDLIRCSYEEVRNNLFGGAWPLCLIFSSLRGLFVSSVDNAPRLYISPPSRFFHHSTLPKPPEESRQLRSDTNSKTTLASASRITSGSIVLTFPHISKKSKTGEKDESQTSAAKFGYVAVRQMDVDRLQPGVFLNDNLVDFYLKYIQLRLMDDESRKRVKIFSSLFFTLLVDHGYERVSNWTQKQNLFDYDFIIVPINMHLHWKVAVICNPGNAGISYSERNARLNAEKKRLAKLASYEEKEEDSYDVKSSEALNRGKVEKKSVAKDTKRETHCDEEESGQEKTMQEEKVEKVEVSKATSMESPRQACILVLDSLGSKRDAKVANTLREFMKFEAKKWKREVTSFDMYNMTAYQPKAPQQTNYTDCGLFLLHYMEKFCLALPEDVSKDAINTMINEDWFPAEEVDGKRRILADCIDSLVKEAALEDAQE